MSRTYLIILRKLLKNRLPRIVSIGRLIPKKNFCILKIWMSNCNYQNISVINIKPLNNDYYGLVKDNCIYKKHG